jgi:hypothetical protein
MSKIENEESGLKGILGQLLVVQGTPAHTQHHWPMPPDQGFKSRFFAVVQETLQQFPIGSNAAIREQRETLQLLAEIIHALGRLRRCVGDGLSHVLMTI